MNTTISTGSLDSSSHLARERFRRLSRLDPVGPAIAAHALLLAALGPTGRTPGLLGLGAAVLVWRVAFTFAANRADRTTRHRAVFARESGSLVLVGVMIGLDGGTESPFFFAMVVIAVWAAAINPLKRFIPIAVAALIVYLAVVLLVPDVTVASIGRFGMLVFFVGLLAWARAVADFWERESRRSKALAGEILTRVPTAFLLFDSADRSCLFANPVARDMGLDRPDSALLSPYGTSDSEATFDKLLETVGASSQPHGPTLYVMSSGESRERFIRVTVAPRRIADDKALLLLVSAEDVSAQVAAGEQQRRFLESANHQFRTPLSPILAYSTLIAGQELGPDDLQEAGESIQDAALRIETLLERISSLLRLQRHPNRELRDVELLGFLESEVFDLAPDLKDEVVVIDGEDLSFRCEPAPLARAVLELAYNSKRHGVLPITIAAQRHGDGVRISIHDAGPGPDLDPDTPLDLTWAAIAHPEQNPPGMGDRLGLSYAVTLIQAAGGTLRFERDQKSWAFTLEFPAAQTQPVAVGAVSRTA